MNSRTLLRDSIEIKYICEDNQRETTSTSIAILVKEAIVRLTNSNCLEDQAYIGLSASKAISTVEISNSRSVFYNSCIHTETLHTSTNSTNVILAGTIKNTTFARCSNNNNCWYVINFQGLKEQRINLTIVDVNRIVYQTKRI